MLEVRSEESARRLEEKLPPTLRLHSVQEVARILKVTPPAVRKLIFGGRLRAQRVGVLIRIPQEAIVRFLEGSPCTEPDQRRDPRRRRSQAKRMYRARKEAMSSMEGKR